MVAYTRRGIAYETNSDRLPEYWYAEAGGLVANNYDGNWKHFLHPRPAPAEPTGLGARIRWRKWEYIATNSAPGTRRWAWVNELGNVGRLAVIRWDEFDPDSIEVLSEGRKEGDA